MPGGRPTKFKEEFCLGLVEHMSQGFSYLSYAAVTGVAESTLYQWEIDYPQFSEAKKKAFSLNRLKWETLCLDSINDPGTLNSTLWIFNMKNRFPREWRDKQEIHQTTKTLEDHVNEAKDKDNVH